MDRTTSKQPAPRLVPGIRYRSSLPTIVECPWQSDMQAGDGIDAITGLKRQRAVTTLVPQADPAGRRSVSSRIDVVAHESDMEALFDTAPDGSFNLYALDHGVEGQMLSALRCSPHQISVVARRTVDVGHYQAEQYPLTGEARGVREPATWRRRYGDYFVAGYRETAVFFAIYHCTAADVSDMQLFVAQLRASSPGELNESSARELQRLASACGIDLQCTVLMSGSASGRAAPRRVAPDHVIEQLERFDRSATGVRSHALLCHYSVIRDMLPARLDVAPATLTTLAELFRKTRFAAALIAAFPPRDVGNQTSRYTHLERRFDTLRYEIQFRMDDMIADTPLLNHQVCEVNDWLHDAQTTLAYQDLRDRCVAWNRDNRTAPGARSSRRRHEWTGGVTRYAESPAVAIVTVLEETFAAPYQRLEKQRHVFRFHDEAWVVVGYQVLANWHDGTCGCWEVTAGGVLQHSLDVQVESLGSRGTNWTVRIFAVRASAFEFD